MNNLQKIITTGLITLPLVLGVPGCKKADNEEGIDQTRTEQVQEDNQLRNAVLSYLSQPKFSNSDFMEQITGTKAELQMLDLRDGMIYLSIPENHFSKESLGELAINPDLVEFGKTSDGEFSGNRIELGNYVLRNPGNYFFRFPSNNFRVDETDQINIQYGSANYSINMKELQDFVSNESVYGGYLNVGTGTDRYGRHKIIANHGALVAKERESSLERLVSSLTINESTDEGKTQRLLDFVTEELKYDYSDANSNVEVLKRPNEVLMTGGSDCSGKVILYASLLEQTDVNYMLVYSDGHITVAVEGDYGNRNGLSFNIGDTTYSIAETTAKGFQIGQSRLTQNLGVEDIKYIQKPGEDSKIYDAKTGKALPFR
ncbi:hypothetical protein ISS04_04000 [Candidatus Woesearchaeota archaeon]|nr:hypothetical protein [Candidatus Woesearchaeota archaeon]